MLKVQIGTQIAETHTQFVNEMSFRSSCGWAQSQMGATGSIRKQETTAVEHRVNSLNTVDNLVLCVAMTVPYIAINQASTELHNQLKQVNSHPSVHHVKTE